MLELYFSVKADTLPGDVIHIAGSSTDLGIWEPHKALSLTYNSGKWEGSLQNVKAGKKFFM